MSFSVEEKHMEFDKDMLLDDEGEITGLNSLLVNFASILDGYNPDEVQSNMVMLPNDVLDLDNLEFDIYLSRDEKLNIDYKEIKSDGPIAGFVGSFLDLDSGYILMGDEKREDYIALYNFYQYLKREYGIYVNKELMTSLVERVKLWDIGFQEMAEELMELGRGNIGGGSIISYVIQEEESSTGEEKPLGLFGVLSPFIDLSVYLHAIYYLSTGASSEGVSVKEYGAVSEMEKAEEGASKFLYSFMEEKSKSAWVRDYMKYEVRYDVEELDSDEITNKIRNLSTMSHVGVNKSRFSVSHKDVADLSKTESEMLNMYDLADSYEEEDDSFIEMDDLLTTSKPNVDNDTIHEVRDKVGMREYLSGMRLGGLAKRFRHKKDKMVEIINNVNADLTSTMIYTETTDRKGMDRIIKGFRRNVKFYNRVLKEIDKILR